MASPFVELEVGERTVKVTNPDKVLFPDRRAHEASSSTTTSRSARGSSTRSASWPTLRRFPDGIAGEQIYQKRVPEKRPEWIEVARVTFPSDRHADELCVTEVAQVIWGANLAVIDFHPWPSRRTDVDRPDELRIDVDPQPGTTFADGKRVAAIVREVLAEMGYTELAEDVGQPRHPHRSAHRAALGVPRRASLRAPSRARSSGERRPSSPPPGGRRSAARRSSSTTTRAPT